MSVTAYFKLWFANENGEAVFGEGLAILLEAVEEKGSIFAASSHLNMSYRYALHRISLAEKRLGYNLIKRHRGGVVGGFSELTTEGKKLLRTYKKFEKELKEFLEVHRCKLQDK